LPQTDPGHPYCAAGAPPSLDELAAEAARLGAALGAAGLPHRVDLRHPAEVAAVTGQVRLAGMVQASIAAGDLSAGLRHVAVVAISGLGRPQPELVAASLAQRSGGRLAALGVTARPALPDLDGSIGPEDLDEATVARALEAPGGAEALGEAVRAALVASGWASVDLALLPAVLGLGDPGRVADRVAGAAGVSVAELLTAPPSAPGWRLQTAAERLVRQSGARMITAEAAGVETQDGRVVAVLARGGERHACEVLVLAAGKFIGGGLIADPRLREPVGGLPVFVGDQAAEQLGPRDLVSRFGFRDQPFTAAGLRTDAQGRALDRFGRPAYDNVLACGSVLAGLDTTLRAGGLGVAAYTAARAGRTAADLAARATA
jgi:glycerol-3-phosphate dehydrogenase subunit B